MRNWEYFNKFEAIDDKYLPAMGEGETMASQVTTAVTKLVYKWFNDGDVFDNTGSMDGWCNDLSSYANWLDKHVAGAGKILGRIYDVQTENDYVELLADLCDAYQTEEFLEPLSKIPKQGSIYKEKGRFVFRDYSEDEEEEEERW